MKLPRVLKRALIGALLSGLAGGEALPAQEHSSEGGAVVWCGLDYSLVKMIGTLDFRQPDQIFPGMLLAWNGLFMKEMLPQLEKMAKSVRTDLKAVETNNAKASATQIQHEDGTRDEMVTPSHISQADLANVVRAYELKNDKGLGLVFIMDRWSKPRKLAACT